MVRMTLKWIPHRPLVAAAALLATGLADTADAQIHHRQRHYQRGGQYQYCPPSDYYTSPYNMPAGPRQGADGMMLPFAPNQPRAGETQPGQTEPGAQTSPGDTSGQQPGDQPSDTGLDNQNLFDQADTQAPSAPSVSSIASAPASASPNMIGDFFGGVGIGSSSIMTPTLLPLEGAINPNYAPMFVPLSASPVGFNVITGPILNINTTVLSVLSANQIDQQFDAGGPFEFALQENADLTNEVIAAYGPAQYVSGEAVQTDPGALNDLDAADRFSLFFNYQVMAPVGINVPSPGTSTVGRVKMAENVSPIPRDRVFMNYSRFDDVAFLPQGVDVNRFVPGFEKTFLDGIVSAEMRFPFASTLSPDIIADGVTSDDEVVFGNMSLIFKSLIYQDATSALAGGLQVAVPTADDVRVFLMNGTELIHVRNESVHLMPYVGGLYTPNDRFFAQGFIQVDIDANGNPVRIVGNDVGELSDATFMYFDAAFGYWLYRSNCCCDRITGIAPIFEAHWNTTVEDTEAIGAGPLRVGTAGQDIDIVNLVFGCVVEMGSNTTITTAYSTPVSDDQDFDGELRLIFNHRFGPQSRASRAQF